MEIVDKKPEEGMELNINGEKGKSLFYHPYYQYVQKDVQRISEQYERYKALFEEAKEERLLAIIGALCVEEALDLFLKTWIKDYKMIEEEKEFTKINIAYSLELIPKHILDAVDLIRKIRNEFVHNLIIDKFGFTG